MKTLIFAAICCVALNVGSSRADPVADALRDALKDMLRESATEDDMQMVENYKTARERQKKVGACRDGCFNDFRNSLRPGESARCQDRTSCSQCWSQCGRGSD